VAAFAGDKATGIWVEEICLLTFYLGRNLKSMKSEPFSKPPLVDSCG
jgi:hypothetical protein